jgi:phytoene dehydrogenase-like protein
VAYFRDVSRAATAFGMNIMRRNSSAVARGVGTFAQAFLSSRWDLTTKAYLDEHFKDPKLKAILASQWGDYGLPPSQSPFMLHSLIVHHYLNGAWYPVGGAGTFAEGAREIVEASGGRILLSREVTEVLIENGRAIGVRVRNGRGETEEYRAPVVVSNAGAALTYAKLLPADQPISFRDSLARFVERHPPTSHLSLYVGFSRDPRELGFRGENHWLFKRYDHDANYARLGQWIEGGEPEEVYLSFPSLKDPEAKAHTAELVTFTDYESFSKWKHQPWRRRDAQYQALKERITEALLDFVERRHPGFRELVEFRELSTPLTNEFMTGHHRGAIYGLPSVPERFRKENLSWTRPKTPVEGLYLTGADVSSLGIVGAMMGGLTTLGYLPDGISMPRAFSAAAKAWPL